MSRLRAPSVIALAVLAGCRVEARTVPIAAAPKSAVAQPSVEGESWSELPTTIAWPAGTVAIALPPGGPAPWLMPPFEPGLEHALDGVDVVAIGDRVALARGRGVLVVAHVDDGVLGAIATPPDLTWAGLGRDDRIFAADAKGMLLRADSPAAAVASGLARVPEAPAATRWDAAGPWLAGAQGDTVFVSDDDGISFRPRVPKRGQSIGDLAVRADGVMAVVVGSGPSTRCLLSGDGGGTWRRSEWTPLELEREGGWIVGYRERTGVLAVDGRSWVEGFDRAAALKTFAAWESDFDTHFVEPTIDGRRRPTIRDLVPPPRPRTPMRDPRRRPADTSGEMTGVGGFGLSGRRPPCTAGPACLHGLVGDAPPPAAVDFHVFADGRCRTGQEACPFAEQRPMHVLAFDHRDGTHAVGPLPATCARIESADARGLGVIVCGRLPDEAFIVVDEQARAHLELQVEDTEGARPGLLDVAPDGTIVVPDTPNCALPMRAWVRRPVPAGTRDAWHEVWMTGARTVLAVGRGWALVVADHAGQDARRADLWLVGPQEGRRLVAEGVRLPDGVDDVRVDDGRVSFHADGRWLALQDGGSFVAVELPDRTRVVDGITVSRAQPVPGCELRPQP